MADDDTTEEQPPAYDSELHDFLSWRHRKRSHADLTERGSRATGSPSSTRSRSIASAEISQSSPRKPSNPDRLSPPASSPKELSETHATVPEEQSPSPTSNLFEPEGEHLDNSPLLCPPARSQRPNRPCHNEKTGTDPCENEVPNITAPTLDIQLRDQDTLFRWTLPEIDTSSLTWMISDQAFHHHHGSHGLGIHHDARSTPRHDATTHRDREVQPSPSSATPSSTGTTVSPTTTAASAADSPHLPPLDHPSSASTGIPTPGPNRGYGSPKPPGTHRCDGPESWSESHAMGRRPLIITFERDDQGPTVGQWQHRPDAAGRVPCPTSQQGTATIAVPRTSVRRGGRDWLAYQATRGELEHRRGGL